VRHPLFRPGMTANSRYHDVMEMYDLFRCKAAISQPVRWVRFTYGKKWKVDLVKAIIFHGPEYIAPCRIQRFDITITLCTIGSELFQGRWRRAHRRVVAAQFIVRLPTHDMGVLSVTFCHRCGDTLGLPQIGFARKIIMPPRSESANLTGVNINGKNIRIFCA